MTAETLLATLIACNGHLGQAAARLGYTRNGLYTAAGRVGVDLTAARAAVLRGERPDGGDTSALLDVVVDLATRLDDAYRVIEDVTVERDVAVGKLAALAQEMGATP